MKTFEFSREGLNQALKHKDYIGIVKETIENHPEILPVALLLAVGTSALFINPMASAVAYKSSVDSSIIAFKYLGGL